MDDTPKSLALSHPPEQVAFQLLESVIQSERSTFQADGKIDRWWLYKTYGQCLANVAGPLGK
jgi:hypothetical protein